MGDPAGDDPRLARAGAGQDQERAVDVRHGLALRGGQIGEQVHDGSLSLGAATARIGVAIGAARVVSVIRSQYTRAGSRGIGRAGIAGRAAIRRSPISLEP